MDENELGMNVGYEADYRGKYMPIENTPLINDGSEIGMENKLKEAAEKFLPYETHPDKFTQDKRNEAIDFGRLCFVEGAKTVLRQFQKLSNN